MGRIGNHLLTQGNEMKTQSKKFRHAAIVVISWTAITTAWLMQHTATL